MLDDFSEPGAGDDGEEEDDEPFWVPPSPDDIAELFPDHEIQDLIGLGGMGAVYRAWQPSLKRLVAIKILRFEFCNQEEYRKRFRREAEVLASFNHPNIISVFDRGRTFTGQDYFVMEYVDGDDLHNLIQSGAVDSSSFQFMQILSGVCGALQYMHERNYVHRDIKPANIFVTKDGQVKVGDFGAAKVMNQDGPRLTRIGTAIGTPEYISPETRRMANGEAVTIDHRSDIYSLGVLIYEAVTGKPPGPMAAQNLSRDARRRLDPRLKKIMTRALQENPDHRFTSVGEINQVLYSPGRRRRVRAIMAAVVLGLVGLVGWYSWKDWNDPYLWIDPTGDAIFDRAEKDSLVFLNRPGLIMNKLPKKLGGRWFIKGRVEGVRFEALRRRTCYAVTPLHYTDNTRIAELEQMGFEEMPGVQDFMIFGANGQDRVTVMKKILNPGDVVDVSKYVIFFF